MNRKIAMITERADVSLGGAERSLSELCAALQTRGLDVTLLAARGDRHPDNVRILCQGRPRKRTPYPVFQRILRQHLDQTRYDIIHSALPFSFAQVYQPRGGSYAETILRSAASYENHWITGFKRLTAFTNRRRQSLVQAERALCQDPNGPVVAALSHYVVEQFKTHYQLNPRRIALVPNGVKVNGPVDKTAVDKLRDTIRSGLQRKQTRTLLLFAAHNFRLKGLSPLLRALVNLKQKDLQHPCALLVTGKGDASAYARMARHLGVAQNVVFAGAVANIQAALSVVDVAVLPTFYDPASRFILEALARGVPVITTQYNGAADLFVDHRHGRIIDSPTDVKALSEALVQMSRRDTLANMRAAIRRDNIRQHVSIERAAGQLIELYETVHQRKGAG